MIDRNYVIVKFYVNGYTHEYKLKDKSLVHDVGGWKTSNITLNELLQNFKLPPWKPKKNENYYIPNVANLEKHSKCINDETYTDEVIFSRGIQRKTPEEAIELTKLMLECAKEEKGCKG